MLVPEKRHRGEPGHEPHGHTDHTDHTDEPHNHPNPPTHGRPYPPTHSRPVATHTPWHGFPERGRAQGRPLPTGTAPVPVVYSNHPIQSRSESFRLRTPYSTVQDIASLGAVPGKYPGTNTQLQAYTGDSESVERRRGEPGAGSRDTHRIAHSLNGTHRARCSVLERRYKAKGGTAHLSLLSLTSYQTVLPLDPA